MNMNDTIIRRFNKRFCNIVVLINVSLLIFYSCKNSEVLHSNSFDIIIYGATSSGVISAIQSARLNKKTLLIAKNAGMIGGMTTNGLGNTDIGKIEVVGGITNEFYRKIGQFYGLNSPMIRFEPKVASKVFKDMLEKESNITIVYHNELHDGALEVVLVDNKIKEIVIPKRNQAFKGKVFIDASYEGDLMAISGVNYFVGRESNSKYNETLNGATELDLSWPIDVYKSEGDLTSGLLPHVNNISNTIGSQDNKIQAYNFRLCMTNIPENRISIKKPDNYNELDYEMLIRMANKKPNNNYLSVVALPNNKFDVNNNGYVSTDLPGVNYAYPNGDYILRERIETYIKDYIKGYIWTLQNDVRIPEGIRKKYENLGLCRDEFINNNNWPYIIYIREGRRMVGEYIITENDVLNNTNNKNSIGKGSYGLDCHAVQYLTSFKNQLAVEGGIYKDIKKPYSICYESILPKKKECKNLLVTVCLSASHVAYSSLRMEPVYMILGQSAGVAASISIDSGVALHDINYTILKEKLIELNQIL